MTPQSTLKTTPKTNHNKKQGAKSAKASPSAPVATYSGRGNQTIVRKSNDLIQNAMYSLSLSQQKLMLHIFAMIKPSDTELPRYEMSIYEFLKLCGVDPHNGSMYKQVKKNIEDIANAKVQWIRLAGTQKITMFRWLSSATIDEGTGKIVLTLDQSLKPHLIQLKEFYTTMNITYTLPMKSQYSLKIYELCKSYQSLYLKKKAAGEPLVWNLSMLYEQLSYTANRWSDFRRLALEKAKAEINEKTDIIFNYDVYEKKGQKVLSLVVTIDPVDDAAAQANLDSINSTVRKKSKKKGRPTVAIEDSLLDDPSVITFDYVSAPETTIPYSFGRHRTELREEIVVKARMDQLRAEITPEELHAVEVIIDVLADACCTIQAGDGEQDGGNKTVFGKMNAIILDCGGLTSWLAGVAPRYAQEIIPRSQTMRSPARYLNKVLREDMDNYRIYIFRKAKPAAEPKEELLEAEYHVMDEPVQQTMPEPESPKVELIPETIVKRQDMRKEFAKFVDDGYLEKTLTSGQRGAYHEIYRHLAARCVPSPSSLRNGLKDEMRLHYLACMNEVIEKYGSLTPLMEAMAHELDFDVFWAKAAKDPNVNNPMGLFYHIIEERALNPIGTIMNDQAQRQKVAAKEKGEKDKWHNESWMDAFEEDIPDDSEE